MVGLVGEAGWGELVAVPTHAIAVIPDGVSDAAAAVLPIAGLTAWRALEMGGLLLGSRVLVTGAAGGVGRLAIQLANLAADVTAVVGRPERRTGLVQLGAADVVVGIEAATVLCPFAKAVHVKGLIRYAVSEATTPAELLVDLKNELNSLSNMDVAGVSIAYDTTLLIAPYCLQDFLDFNDFLGKADKLLCQNEARRHPPARQFSPRLPVCWH